MESHPSVEHDLTERAPAPGNVVGMPRPEMVLNDLGRQTIDAWLKYHARSGLDPEPVYAQAEALAAAGKFDLTLPVADLDARSRRPAGFRLPLQATWFDLGHTAAATEAVELETPGVEGRN
jgi:hypothetical protein